MRTYMGGLWTSDHVHRHRTTLQERHAGIAALQEALRGAQHEAPLKDGEAWARADAGMRFREEYSWGTSSASRRGIWR